MTKKIFSLMAAVVIAASMVNAKEYKNSIGMVAGTGIGVQFKTMVQPHFTIIEEFGYLGDYAAAGNGWTMGYMGAIDNLVLAYQATATEGQGIQLDWYAGGQIRGGYTAGDGGVVGGGAAAGIEANMQNAPIAFSFDFRPGYVCMFVPGASPTGGLGIGHAFDWALNLGVRYTF